MNTLTFPNITPSSLGDSFPLEVAARNAASTVAMARGRSSALQKQQTQQQKCGAVVGKTQKEQKKHILYEKKKKKKKRIGKETRG